MMAKDARCYIAVIVIFLAISILFLGLTIHYATSLHKQQEEANSTARILKELNFFRTRMEQKAFEMKFFGRKMELVIPICDSLGLSQNVSGTHGPSYVRPLDSNEVDVNHACCESTVGWISPDTAQDTDGNTVTLVQYKDERQNFQTQQCCTIQQCDCACRCMQEQYTPNALVYNPEDSTQMVVKAIVVPGCCRCVNNSV